MNAGYIKGPSLSNHKNKIEECCEAGKESFRPKSKREMNRKVPRKSAKPSAGGSQSTTRTRFFGGVNRDPSSSQRARRNKPHILTGGVTTRKVKVFSREISARAIQCRQESVGGGDLGKGKKVRQSCVKMGRENDESTCSNLL